MSGRIILFLVMVILITSSCRHARADKEQHYTETIFTEALKKIHGADTKAGFNYLDSAYATFPFISLADKLRLLGFKAGAYNNGLNPQMLASYNDSVITLLNKNMLADELYPQYAAALIGKAKGYYQMDKAAEAYGFLLDAKNIVKAKGDSCKLADIYEVLANIDYVQQKFLIAAENYKEKYRLIQYCHNGFLNEFGTIQGVLNNIGTSYIKGGNTDSALVYLDKGIDYVIKNEAAYHSADHLPQRALGVLYGNKAQVFIAKGMYGKAEEFFKKDIAINGRPGYEAGDAALVTLQLADIYMKTKNYDDAYKLLSQVKPNLVFVDDRYKVEWKRLMWDYYGRTGDSSKAYTALKEYAVQKDSLNNRLRLSSGTNAASEMARLETQKELDLFKKDKELSRLTQNALIFSVILVLCIAALILYNWVRSKQTIVKLSQLNKKISEREYQLERLLDELEVKEKHKREEELLLLEQEMQERQADAIIEQRKRISEDLHDDISSSLAALKYFITDLKNNAADTNTKNDLASVESELSTIYENTRNYLHRLNDKSYHLKYDLVRLLEELQKRSESFSGLNITVHFDKAAVKKHLTERQSNQLYHITREMLTNILKHSGATLVEIELAIAEKQCTFIVTDNGHGFVPQQMKAGLGLNSIANRVDFLEGKLDVTTVAARTRFKITFAARS